MNNLPKIRTNNLLQQETERDLLVYDLEINKALCLNETSARVWKLCNGKIDCQEISKQTNIPQEFVWAAIEELQRNNLLEFEVETGLPKDRLSRRKMLMKAGATAVALPLIVGIIAPVSSAAQSGIVIGGICPGSGGSPGCLLFLGNNCGTSAASCQPSCSTVANAQCTSMVGLLTPGCPACQCYCG